jgi:hypothetical protein
VPHFFRDSFVLIAILDEGSPLTKCPHSQISNLRYFRAIRDQGLSGLDSLAPAKAECRFVCLPLSKRDSRENDNYAVLIIILLPLLINLPSLLGWWSVDPIFVSRIASFYPRQLFPGFPFTDPNVGWTAQALGKLSADEWLSGRIPWWNYYSGVGLPLAAEMQPGALFLPLVLLNHFSNGTLYIKVILQILSGLGTYLLLKKIGLLRLSAIAGAILYEFNGAFALHGAPNITPMGFLPWLILGIERAREKAVAGAGCGWLTIAISLALSIYAGFPETAYIDGLLAAVWSLWRIVNVQTESRYRFIMKLATGVIVGLLLSVPIIIPFAEYVGHSDIGFHNIGFLGLYKEALPLLFLPWLYGGICTSPQIFWVQSNVGGFLSATQLAVIVTGLFATRRCSLYIVLLLWILICIGRTFALPLVSTLVDLVPLLKQTLFFRYSPPSWTFCSAVLCAMVINDISLGHFHSLQRSIGGLLCALAIAAISLYPAWNLVRELYVLDGYRVFLWVSLSWGLASMLMAAFLFKLAKERPAIAGRAITALLAIDAIALFSVPLFSGGTSASSSSDGVNYLKKRIGRDRFYTLGPIAPNYGAYYHIASINYSYLPVAENWVEYIREHIDPYADQAVFDGFAHGRDPKAPTPAEVLRENIGEYEQIGVRYVVTFHSQNPFEREQEKARPQRVFESTDMDIYELPGARPYFEVVQGECDLHGENRSTISVNCSLESKLIRRELYYPGWKASLGGRNVHIEAYNGIFQAIKIPPGQYEITFSYTPTHMRGISVSFLLGVLWLTTGMIRSRTHP